MSCKENTTMKCNCTYSCPRRGKCCECLAYHTKSGEFPACFFTKEGEASYDRSFAQLIKDRNSK